MEELEKIRGLIRQAYAIRDLDGTGYDREFDMERSVKAIHLYTLRKQVEVLRLSAFTGSNSSKAKIADLEAQIKEVS